MHIEIPEQGAIAGPIDCIITGGHGNVNLWQCHYPEAGTEGYMRSSGGKLYGTPYSGGSIQIDAPTPKVYWCASNCLMGNPDNENNFVYAAFKTGNAVQMFGFVNNASAGDEFMAWGVYDRVTKCAGKYTMPQGFFLSNNNAMFEIEHPGGQMNTSLVANYMDSTVFYGDPAADVKFVGFGDSANAYKTELSYSLNNSGSADFVFTFTMLAHDLEYGAGYCYQFRPISLLPVRIDPATTVITRNEGHLAEITDNLLIWEMLSKGEKLARGESKTLRWTAEITDLETGVVKPPISIGRDLRPRLLALASTKKVLINVNNLPPGRFNIQIFDLSGKQCYRKQFVSSGIPRQSFSLGDVAGSGINLVVLTRGGLTLKVLVPVRSISKFAARPF